MAFNNVKLKGRTTYNNSIIVNIVTLAVAEVDGVAPTLGADSKSHDDPSEYLQKLKLDFDEKEVFVGISINIFDGYSVPDVAFKVQESVKHNIENMTKFHVSSVDVTILGIEMNKK